MSEPNTTTAAPQDPPWSDLKVAFDAPDVFDTPDEAFDAFAALQVPRGWVVNEIDGAGARLVVVFRVDHPPSCEEGEAVVTALNSLHPQQGSTEP